MRYLLALRAVTVVPVWLLHHDPLASKVANGALPLLVAALCIHRLLRPARALVVDDSTNVAT